MTYLLRSHPHLTNRHPDPRCHPHAFSPLAPFSFTRAANVLLVENDSLFPSFNPRMIDTNERTPCACTYVCAPAEPHERVPVRLCREQRRRVCA